MSHRAVRMARSVTPIVLALTACACSFDTSPAYQHAAARDGQSGAGATQLGPTLAPPGSVSEMQAGPAKLPIAVPAARADAGAAVSESDAAAANAPDAGGAPQPSSDAGGMAAADPDSSSLLDGIRDLLANSPAVAEADALRRIMAALSAPGGTPDVPDALDALGDVDCTRNSRTCIAVCSWAVLNCEYCAGDATCDSACGV